MTNAEPRSTILLRYCAVVAGGIGVVALAGWIIGVPTLLRIHPQLVTVKANTAIALILASLSLLLLQDENATRARRGMAHLFAAAITALALLTLGQYLFGWDTGIDQFLFREPIASAGQTIPGRMSLASTVVFTCVGTALMILDIRIAGQYWANKLALVAGAATTLVFLYYFLGIQEGKDVPPFAPMALLTVIASFALCGGIFFARPNRGIMLELMGGSIGSTVARRMLPAAFFVPILLGWGAMLGERAGYFSQGVGTAAFVVLIILLFTGLIRTTAAATNRQEAERMRAEADLARLAAIVTTCNDAIISKTLDGTITSWNPGAERTFGHTADEMIGQSILRLIPPELLDEEKFIINRLKAGELINHFETERVKKDGSRIPVSLTISPICGASGTIIGVSKIARDITERKQAESALETSEKRFRVMADNIAQLAWMAEPDGHVFFYNQRWYDYTGTTLEEMQGWGWKKVHAPDHLRRMLPAWKASLKSGEPWEDTFPLRGKDGEYRWFLSRAFPIRDSEGQIVRWFGTNIDIDDHRRAMEELAGALRAKDDFISALSHELRTPLTPVLMMATALQGDHSLPAEVRDQLAMMLRNIELEARLIDDLLDLTRITHDKLDIEPVATDIHEVLDYTAEIVLSDRLGKDVGIEFSKNAVRHHAMADPARLQQVFWNLIKNAIKFSLPGQRVTVSTHTDKDGKILVTVADEGVGISAEAMPNIFKAFEQGDIAGKHRYGGLGLGLAISKAIMEAHGTTICVESAGVGRGATFKVTLDSIEPPTRPLSCSAATSGAGTLRLLIVEDHETTRTVLSQLLTRRGHEVTTTGSVKEALSAYGDSQFDMVISDIGLPDGSGMDLMREIQLIRPVPAIALSGYGMEDDVRRAREAGFTAHLVKPVNLDQLRQIIDQISRT